MEEINRLNFENQNDRNIEIEQQQKEKEENKGKALASFIISAIALLLDLSVVFAFAGMICGVIGLGLSNAANKVTKNPQKTFRIVAKPISIVALAYGGIVLVIFSVFVVLGVIKTINYYLPEFLPGFVTSSSISSITSSITSN